MSDATDFLAAGAAVLAAALSAVSLALTRRWQQDDLALTRTWQENDKQRARREEVRTWALDGLRQALIDHVNLSFKIGHSCSEALAARARSDQEGSERAFERARELHTDYMDLMVYLRLLSTPSIVASAEELHLWLDYLLDLTFVEEVARNGLRPFVKGGDLPEGLTATDARRQCMKRREELINEARQYFYLPGDAVINPTI